MEDYDLLSLSRIDPYLHHNPNNPNNPNSPDNPNGQLSLSNYPPAVMFHVLALKTIPKPPSNNPNNPNNPSHSSSSSSSSSPFEFSDPSPSRTVNASSAHHLSSSSAGNRNINRNNQDEKITFFTLLVCIL